MEDVSIEIQDVNLAIEMPGGVDGVGVPPGGTAGQVLAKIDATSFNTEWVDPTGGGPGGLQPLDGDLTAIAALSPSNDDIIQRKAGAWTNRSIAQLKTDLNISEAKTVGVLVSDPNGDAITTGDGKAYLRIPTTVNGMNLTGVAASVSTVSSSGAVTVQIRRVRSGTPVDMLSTALTIDASETDSSTAATAAVINTGNDDVATADQVYIDIDGAGTGAKGLFCSLIFQAP